MIRAVMPLPDWPPKPGLDPVQVLADMDRQIRQLQASRDYYAAANSLIGGVRKPTKKRLEDVIDSVLTEAAEAHLTAAEISSRIQVAGVETRGRAQGSTAVSTVLRRRGVVRGWKFSGEGKAAEWWKPAPASRVP